MSELKRYVNKVSWTESVSQHKEAIIFMHDRQIKSLQSQLAKREDDYRKLRERSDEQIEDLERQLAEARENIYKFAEIALMEGKDEFGRSWEDFKFYVLDEQLMEQGE